jgi:hypothetical protein
VRRNNLSSNDAFVARSNAPPVTERARGWAQKTMNISARPFDPLLLLLHLQSS